MAGHGRKYTGTPDLSIMRYMISILWNITGKQGRYPGFISLSCCRVKPRLSPQIFPICEGEPLSLPGGEAAPGVPPRPRIKLKYSNNIRARRGPPTRRPSNPEGMGFFIVLNIFILEKTSNNSDPPGGVQVYPRRYGIPIMR